MKTTIEIADRLLLDAKRVAARERTTVRALVEAGLRGEIARRKAHVEAFRLRAASFKGEGLQDGAVGVAWDRLRELAYEGRGG